MYATKPIGSKITLSPLNVQGVDYGGKLTLIARNECTIALKADGHMAWAGVGQGREYVPPHVLVFKILKENGDMLEVEPLIEWNTGRKK